MSIVIGLGTGRCGTVSLAKLLHAQPNSHVTHEDPPLLPWQVDLSQLGARLAQFKASEHQLVGDVAFYYLPYVRHIAKADESVRFVCLKRDREATIASYLKKTGTRNHWYLHNGDGWEFSPWDQCFPKYEIADKAAAIGKYWDAYYEEAETLSRELKHFRIWDMQALNTPAGVADILDFVGVGRKRVVVGIRRNQGIGWARTVMEAIFGVTPSLASSTAGRKP